MKFNSEIISSDGITKCFQLWNSRPLCAPFRPNMLALNYFSECSEFNSVQKCSSLKVQNLKNKPKKKTVRKKRELKSGRKNLNFPWTVPSYLHFEYFPIQIVNMVMRVSSSFLSSRWREGGSTDFGVKMNKVHSFMVLPCCTARHLFSVFELDVVKY